MERGRKVLRVGEANLPVSIGRARAGTAPNYLKSSLRENPVMAALGLEKLILLYKEDGLRDIRDELARTLVLAPLRRLLLQVSAGRP